MELLNRGTPRWVIFLIDLIFSYLSIWLAYQLRFNFSIPQVEYGHLEFRIAVIAVVRGGIFLLLKTYSGFVRYTASKDVQRLIRATVLGSFLLILVNYLVRGIFGYPFILPTSVILIDFFILTVIMVAYRILIKMMYFEYKGSGGDKELIVIFGAGDAGIIAKRTLDRELGAKYKVVAFIDENKSKIGKSVEGVKIYSFKKLPQILQKNRVDRLIIAVQDLKKEKKAEIIEECLPFRVKIQHVPPVKSWINGELSLNQIRNVRIEDLLGRSTINLDNQAIASELADKRILITGCAGSIGAGLVRQIARFAKGKVILLDQAESPLYELELELKETFPTLDFEVVMGSIRNEDRMRNMFQTFRPTMVFHAAAYKHVPLMEENPTEAIRTNVMGTKILADLSVEFGIEKFVMVSTDKAVNPTNVMGASKRIAEIYTQSLDKEGHKTRFVTTRFGNVLGSNGSVIPLFRKQIEQGGPIKVTHPDITRFFMTIPEACQLVLQAASMGNGGEIFVFNMGKPVRIADLAKQMITLSGLHLGTDIEIEYTGLRPGEKLYEELLASKENTIPTSHPQILTARVRTYKKEEIMPKISELIDLYCEQDNMRAVRLMKELVPEYKSQNSIYEKLDQQGSLN